MTNLFILLALNGIVFLTMFLYFRRMISRSMTQDAQLEQLRSEVQYVILELNQTTDRNIGLIEDRISALNELLAGTDKRIGLLRRELEKHEMSTKVYSNIVKKQAPPPQNKAEAPAPSQEVKKSLREQVLDLHQKGIAPALIAQKLGTTIGEVELMISLTQKQL